MTGRSPQSALFQARFGVDQIMFVLFSLSHTYNILVRFMFCFCWVTILNILFSVETVLGMIMVRL